MQITGLTFSSLDSNHLYVQGVDYEVIVWNLKALSCFSFSFPFPFPFCSCLAQTRNDFRTLCFSWKCKLNKNNSWIILPVDLFVSLYMNFHNGFVVNGLSGWKLNHQSIFDNEIFLVGSSSVAGHGFWSVLTTLTRILIWILAPLISPLAVYLD